MPDVRRFISPEIRENANRGHDTRAPSRRLHFGKQKVDVLLFPRRGSRSAQCDLVSGHQVRDSDELDDRGPSAFSAAEFRFYRRFPTISRSSTRQIKSIS
jgi:hypothetical protein